MNISPKDIESLKSPLFLDVRNPDEWEIGHIEGAVLIPLPELAQKFTTIPKDKPLVVYCHHGGRSELATQWLRANGYPEALNLEGGIDLWSQTIDASIPRY